MKLTLFLAALVVFVSYLTCKNFRQTTATVPQQEVLAEPEKNLGLPWKASHVIEGSNPDSAYTYQVKKAPKRVEVPWQKIAPPSTSRRTFMATGWWNPRFAYQGSDTTVHLNYLGKSLKFKEDQTFEIFKGKQVIDAGHWAYDDPKKILYISCQNTYFNNTWKLQENGFRMVWIGNTDLNVTGIQMRLDGSKTPPEGQ